MFYSNLKKSKIFLLLSFFFLFSSLFLIPYSISAATIGETKSFYIDSSYDISGREKISANLRKISSKLYFYIDVSWWNTLNSSGQNQVEQKIDDLADEFEEKIYPTLISNFGSEWKPGIDKDNHITVLIHPMKSSNGGYFSTGDGYSKYLVPTSNEKEMVYISTDYITTSLAKSFLAHELVHLITFNQKDRIRNVEEEVWLNEARAEYASTLCGYDLEYQGSNLENRVGEFLKNPSDSITEWGNSSVDYGALNLFIQYLNDHYGKEILKDSLHSSEIGISSINYALEKNGFEENFSDVFTDWTITVLVNDCSLGEKYCYKNKNLKNLRLVPSSNFLPLNLSSTLSVSSTTKNWAGKWYKIFGGGGTLFFEFNGFLTGNFKVPYIICEQLNNCSVNFLDLGENQDGEVILEDFNTKYTSLTIIPSAQNDSYTSNLSFSWKARINMSSQKKEEDSELIEKLLAQIAELEAEIVRVQAQINAILASRGNTTDCQNFNNNLYFGMRNHSEVSCLQQFLKNQGSVIYPEGLITGNFLSLTKAAVIRFQEKYSSEILNPFGLERGTGYVGEMTKKKINEILGF